jgi:hypothetical protein
MSGHTQTTEPDTEAEQEAGGSPARSSDALDLSSPGGILALQRAAGNAAVGRALALRQPKTKAKSEPKLPPWSIPSKRANADELAIELDIALRTAPMNFADTGVWVHLVIAGGRLHLYDTDMKPLGTWRLNPNARIPGDGYYLSAFGPDPSAKPPRYRWYSFRLGVEETTDEDTWFPQGFGTRNDKGDLLVEDWLSPADRAAFDKASGTEMPTRIGVIVSGYGEAGAAEKAKKQVGRVKGKIAKEKTGEGKGDKNTDATQKKLPDSVTVVEDKKGIHVRLMVDGARQDIEYRDGETDAKLLDRIKDATQKVRDEIDPSKAVRVGPPPPEGAPAGKISQKPGAGGVAVPEGFPITPEGRVPNAPAYPAKLISHGPDAAKPSDLTVNGATLDYTMQLDYAAMSYGTQDEVFNRLQPIAFKWELIDITNLDVEKMKAKMKEAGEKTDSGITQDLERKLSNTWEDTVNDVKDMAGSPAFGQYMGLVAVSDLIQVGGALISSFFSVISQPLEDRSIGFNKEGTFILRCFAQPVITDYAKEKEAAGEWKLLIRAPSVAVRGVQVTPINKRAQQANDVELTTIETLKQQLENVPLMYTKEEIQKTLDEAVEGLSDNTIGQVERQIRHTDEELGRVKEWQDADAQKKTLDQRGDSLRLWKARLDLNGTELGPYEAQLREVKPKLEETLKRSKAFGSKGIPGQKFGPRMTFSSEVDGNTYPILANLGETSQSKDGHRIWRLVDFTSADTQDYYDGEGATHNEAIRNAFFKFRDNAGYGRGALAIRLPLAQLKAYTNEDISVDGVMRVRPGQDARFYQRLQDLATAAELAALVVSGPAGMAIGLIGAVAGGIVAAHNLASRAHADRLKWDFQTAMDIVGVVGAVVAVGGAAAKGAQALGEAGAASAKARKLGTTEKAMAGLAKRAVQVGDALHIAGEGMMKGQWIILPIATYHEFEEIAEEEEKDPSPSAAKYKAKRLEALARAIKGGLVQVRMMQMASDPSAGWDPFKEKTPATKTPVIEPPPEPRPATGTGEPVRPPVEPGHTGGGGVPTDVPPPAPPPRKGGKPTSPADKPTIWAPENPHPVGQDNFSSRVTEALGGKHNEPRSQSVQLVEDSLLDALWTRSNKGPMPEGTVAIYDPDAGHLYVSKKAFVDSPELQQQAYDGVMRQMSARGRAALSEPVARAIGEVVLQGAIDGMPPVDAVAPPARALQQRLSQVLGPDVMNRVAFGGEVNTLRSKLAEAYGSARGNALEAALAKGDWHAAARLAGEPNAAMSNAFGEMMANATADMLASQHGGKPRDPARAALAERISKMVGQDLVEGALFRGRTEDLRIALEKTLGPDGVAKLVEAMRTGDVKGASKILGTEHAPTTPIEEREPTEAPPPEHAPPAPPPKPVAPLGPKTLELRGLLERGGSGAQLHEAALDAIAETGSFKELRRQISEGLFGEAGDRAKTALDSARRQVVDEVLAEVFKVIEAKHPGVKLGKSDLGTPGFASDRDVTLKGSGGATNEAIAASVEAVRAAYEILNGEPAPADDAFAAARKKTGGRKLPPDRVLDSNFYTELHEGAVAPRTPAERLGIVEDQSIVSLAEVRANMHDAGEWQAYREKLIDSFSDKAADPHGTEAQLNRLAVDRLARQLDAAQALYEELHPAGKTAEQVLAQVQQQLLEALRTGASPREIRQLQAKIKLLEPDAYGTRAAVVGVVDQYQGAARAETRQKAWEALNKGKEPMTTREAAATSAQEAAASAGKLRHAAPDTGSTPAQCVSAAKYLARIWEAFRKAGLTMDSPLLDRTGEIIGSKQEPNNQTAAMSELRRWAQDHNMQGLSDQQVRDAFVKQVKALGEALDVRLRRNEAVQAGMDPTAAELAAANAPKEPPKPPPKDPPKEPGGGSSGGPPPPPPPAPAPAKYRGYATAAEVRQAAIDALNPLKRSMDAGELPGHYQEALDVLANPGKGRKPGPVNKKLSKLLPIVEAGLRNPELYATVLAEAWERAVMNGTDINAALVDMAREGGFGIKKIPTKAGTLPNDVFFDEHVTNPKRIVDKGVGDEHGVYTHLLQDLVVDRALRAAGRTETGSEFRQLLARAEGRNPNNIGVGDLIWRVTYDAEAPGHLNDPETLRAALDKIGLR